jgi:hypothetical protein
MYILTAIVLVLAAGLTGWDRARDRPVPVIVGFTDAAFGLFAVITALLWIFIPGTTVSFVPGHSDNALVLLIAQGRGIIVLILGVLVIIRRYVPQQERLFAAAVGPWVYNTLMCVETWSAQFSPVATPERWLYVTLHTLWAVAFGGHVLKERHGPISWPGRQRRASLTASWFATYAFGAGGMLLFCFHLLERIFGPAPAPFWQHASHGFGASVLALGAMAWTWVPRATAGRDWTLYALTAANAGLAVLMLAWLVLGSGAGARQALLVLVPVQILWTAAFGHRLCRSP